MWDRCWYMALVIAVLSLPSISWAEEFAGKLERVDSDTITVRGGDDQRLVVKVDGSNRIQAAPFLGKSITVFLSTERGECRVVGFKSPH
jgi:hypothetical protein